MAFVKGQSGNPAGRPRNADKNAGAVAAAEQQIRDRLPSLIENMFRLADGIELQTVSKEGHTLIYTTAPDRAANEYLINRILGKPTERQEMSGPDGGAIPVAFNGLLDKVYGDRSDPTTRD